MKHIQSQSMQNIHSFALIILALLCSQLAAQESSSQSQRPADRPSADHSASPTPAPQTRQRRSVPEVEDAMGKGEDLLFKKHDARASLEEFKRAAKLDPWYGQAYMLQGLAHMQLQEWSDAQWAFEEAAKVEPGNA
ncbi:MAG TPA: hypothetical protein VGN44_15630, partial [Candidatus Angelobacter sp.]